MSATSETEMREEGPMNIQRGDIYYANLSPVVGCEQGGWRPVVVVQNNVGNRHSPTVIVAAITTSATKAKLPTHITIQAKVGVLPRDSMVLLEQIRTLDKRRLGAYIGPIGDRVMNQIDEGIAISLGLAKEWSH